MFMLVRASAKLFCAPNLIVPIQIDNGQLERVVEVEVERPSERKPYMGGYRNKKTGVIFHHAVAQTAVC